MKLHIDHKIFSEQLWIPMAITVASFVAFYPLAIRANPIPV